MKVLHNRKMKICAVVSAGLLMTGIFNFSSLKSVFTKAEETSQISGIGNTINIFTDNISDIRSFPILDLDYIKNGMPTTTRNNPESEGYSFTSFSISEVAEEIKLKYSNKVFGGLEEGAFMAGIEEVSNALLNKARKELVSQYFYVEHQDVLFYSEFLDNADSFLTYYQDHISSNFLGKLNDLKNGTLTYADFFKNYGTHMVAGVNYGGIFDSVYGAYSDKIAFIGTAKTELDDKIEVAISQRNKIGGSIKISLDSDGTVNTANASVFNYFYARGGNVIYASTLSNGEGGLTRWLNGLNRNNAAIVGFMPDGLIPIWEILPSQYSSLKSGMKNAYDAYAASFGDKYNTKEKSLPESLTTTINVRDGEMKFTDDDRWTNSYDTVKIKSDSFAYNIAPLATYGYTTMNVVLSMNFKAVDQATERLIFFYQTAATSGTGNELFKEISFEDDKTSYHTINFSPFSIPITKIIDNQFFIRYRASGAWDDDWKNKEVKVTLTFFKTA